MSLYNKVVTKTKNGFVAIASVLVIASILVSISVTVTILSVGELQSAFALDQGEETLDFVEGCVEQALLKARANFAYAGGNITNPEGTCTVTVSKATNTWTFTVSTTATAYVRTIRAIATWNSAGLTLVSWNEI